MAAVGAGQEEDGFLDGRGEEQQAHDLRDARSGDVGQTARTGLPHTCPGLKLPRSGLVQQARPSRTPEESRTIARGRTFPARRRSKILVTSNSRNLPQSLWSVRMVRKLLTATLVAAQD